MSRRQGKLKLRPNGSDVTETATHCCLRNNTVFLSFFNDGMSAGISPESFSLSVQTRAPGRDKSGTQTDYLSAVTSGSERFVVTNTCRLRSRQQELHRLSLTVCRANVVGISGGCWSFNEAELTFSFRRTDRATANGLTCTRFSRSLGLTR